MNKHQGTLLQVREALYRSWQDRRMDGETGEYYIKALADLDEFIEAIPADLLPMPDSLKPRHVDNETKNQAALQALEVARYALDRAVCFRHKSSSQKEIEEKALEQINAILGGVSDGKRWA